MTSIFVSNGTTYAVEDEDGTPSNFSLSAVPDLATFAASVRGLRTLNNGSVPAEFLAPYRINQSALDDFSVVVGQNLITSLGNLTVDVITLNANITVSSGHAFFRYDKGSTYWVESSSGVFVKTHEVNGVFVIDTLLVSTNIPMKGVPPAPEPLNGYLITFAALAAILVVGLGFLLWRRR
ncbi:MAG: hypothetical protein OK422_06090 [Thaumarchaeota archaeon]|nr:hypothetical protein [Nitrososphaerota archaeon]